MPFFINDRSGVAYEETGDGLGKWDPDFGMFTDGFTDAEEMDIVLNGDRRQVSEDEATAFMLAKDAASGAAAPRA